MTGRTNHKFSAVQKRSVRWDAAKGTMRRTGALLLVVLVTITLLSLSLYAFTETMLLEYRAIRLNIHSSQQQQVARSGIEIARHQLRNRNSGNRIRTLHGVFAKEYPLARIADLQASFAFVHPATKQEASAFATGLENLSGKLNINSLPLELSRSDEARARLMALPGIDLRIADSILDWMDSDDKTRPLGAETTFYSDRGYRPRQGRFQTFGELLKVRGVTKELLFAEDQNANGWLDENENDGEISSPNDDADGCLNRGLSAWLTIDGAESTLNDDGLPKINVNGDRLNKLYDSLEPVIGKLAAQFILAYRLEGPLKPIRLVEMDSESRLQRRLETSEARLRNHLGIESPFESSGATLQDSFRAGLDLSRKGAYRIESLADLIGSRVLVTIDTQQEIIDSPWKNNPQGLATSLIQLEQLLTSTSAQVRIDRINPAAAPMEVLMTIPGLELGHISNIVQSRQRIIAEGTSEARFQSTAWLVTDAGVSFEKFLAAAPYLTPGGDRFDGFALGRLEGSRSQSVMKFQIDATWKTPMLGGVQSLRSIPQTKRTSARGRSSSSSLSVPQS